MLKRYLYGENDAAEASVVCLGFFDGVHLGHQHIVHTGREVADKLNIYLCVHTYDIPPLQLIRQGQGLLELTPFEEKCRLLEREGADIVAVSHFDEQMMHMSGAAFFHEVLLGKLKARHLVAGFDHRFGFHGDTDASVLGELCEAAGIGLSVLAPVKVGEGLVVSSTAIRHAIGRGDRKLAEQMLGRPLSPRLLAHLGPA